MRIKKELYRKHQITIDKETLAKLLNYWGLELRRKKIKYKPSFIQKILNMLQDRANLLRKALISEPLQAISADISEVLFKGGKAYLSIHKDVYAQVVYGWSISLNMEKELVIDSLKKAIQSIQRIFKIKAIPESLIWHQDQGSQYTSYEYINQVMKYGKLSYSRKATPTDNPGQESFFGRLKDEYRDELYECQTIEELTNKISKIIKLYNYQRLHTSIGYLPPMEFLKIALKTPKVVQ